MWWDLVWYIRPLQWVQLFAYATWMSFHVVLILKIGCYGGTLVRNSISPAIAVAQNCENIYKSIPNFVWTCLESIHNPILPLHISLTATPNQFESRLYRMHSSCRTPFAAIVLSLFAAAVAAAPTAYEVIQSYGFPMGVLPKGVTHYDLDASTGKFNAYFNGSCSFSLEGSYQLRYKSTISGYIYKNKLTNLSGVSVKVLFLWLNIVEVRRKGDNLEFSVGIASAEFSLDNFFVCPQCGCGLNCNNLEGDWNRQSLRNNILVSSF